MNRLGVITGLNVESNKIRVAAATLAEADRPLVEAVAGDGERAAAAARAMIASGVRGLVSFGVAGGLDPALRPGDIVLADAVRRADGGTVATDDDWRERIARSLPGEIRVVAGAIVGVDAPVPTPGAKSALRTASAAVAVDMESHGVAAVAAERGLPFLVIRAIADPAARSVPRAALAGMGRDGRRRPFAVLARLLARPRDFPAVLRLGCDSAAALRSLSVVADALVRPKAD